jgi:hypothetical protein
MEKEENHTQSLRLSQANGDIGNTSEHLILKWNTAITSCQKYPIVRRRHLRYEHEL